MRLTKETRINLEGKITWKLYSISDEKIIGIASLLGVELNLTEKDYEQMPLVGEK